MYWICPKESKEEKEEADESSAAPGEEGEGDSEKPATDEENSAMREKMIFGRKKVGDTPLIVTLFLAVSKSVTVS